MEKDFGSWFHNQHSGRQSPHLNHLSASFEVGWQNSLSAYANTNPCLNELSNNGTFPTFAPSGLLLPNACQPNQPWVHNSLPLYPQAFVHPVVNSLVPSEPTENRGRTGILNADTGGAQKKFLVFDQSGDQTTLIYSSGIGAPVPCLKSWNPIPPAANDPIKDDFVAKRCMFPHFNPFGYDLYNESNQRDEDELESQMHEDTEELNALLYSDSESESSEDDEVTSTGHSPSTMTEYGIQDSLEEGEGVASSASPSKKRKLSNGESNVHSPTNAPTPKKPSKLSDELEEDAESGCGNFDHDQFPEESDSSLSGKKRSRKEKIRETVGILQTLIPGVKGKDGMVIIDEAIHYLKSLKAKAKALGLDTL